MSCACEQGLDKGQQKEMPDIWLTNGNPWEIERPEIKYKIGFYGKVDNFKWTPAETVHHRFSLFLHLSLDCNIDVCEPNLANQAG